MEKYSVENVECTYIPIESPEEKNKEIESKIAKLKKQQSRIKKAIQNLEEQKALEEHE